MSALKVIRVQKSLLKMTRALRQWESGRATPNLTAAQVYHALSYYYDNQDEINRLIESTRPEQLVTVQGLQVKKVAEGVAEIHDEAGRW
jgi:hypothetical protein